MIVVMRGRARWRIPQPWSGHAAGSGEENRQGYGPVGASAAIWPMVVALAGGPGHAGVPHRHRGRGGQGSD